MQIGVSFILCQSFYDTSHRNIIEKFAVKHFNKNSKKNEHHTIIQVFVCYLVEILKKAQIKRSLGMDLINGMYEPFFQFTMCFKLQNNLLTWFLVGVTKGHGCSTNTKNRFRFLYKLYFVPKQWLFVSCQTIKRK